MSRGQSVRTVVVANIGEFYLPLYRHSYERDSKIWTEPSRAECDMALFWCGDDKLVITPHPVQEEFVAYVRRVLNYRNVRVVSPAKSSSSICEDILADSTLFALLVETLRNSPDPQIITWGATEQLYVLLDQLQREDVKFRAPEVPARDNYWIVRYLGSKSGFREFCTCLSQRDDDINIPYGFICTNIEMASGVAEWYSRRGVGVVVKANDGVAGYGTLLYRSEQVSQLHDIKAHLLMNARLIPILSAGLVVVEDYIESPLDSEIQSPSVQVVIDEFGNPRVRCLAGQIVEPDGKYVGAIISPEILPTAKATHLRKIAQSIGQAAAALGYRGVFNIDTVLGVDGQVFCVELNARRTSVTYTLDIATHLFGSHFTESMVFITHERFSSKGLSQYTYEDIRSLLSKLLFPMDGESMGILITIPSSLEHFARRPQLGFITLGRDIATTRLLHAQACELLSAGA